MDSLHLGGSSQGGLFPRGRGGRAAGRSAESQREGPGAEEEDEAWVPKEALPADHLCHGPLASPLIFFFF